MRYRDGVAIGMVPAHGTATFEGAAGYKGDRLVGVTYEKEQGEKRGVVDALRVGHYASGRGNGSELWNLTVGP